MKDLSKLTKAELIKLVTKANLEGHYYKPRVDRELLERHNEGLIVLSGCPSGEVPRLVAQGRTDEAKRAHNCGHECAVHFAAELLLAHQRANDLLIQPRTTPRGGVCGGATGGAQDRLRVTGRGLTHQRVEDAYGVADCHRRDDVVCRAR